MNRRNYQRELERIIQKQNGTKPRLLLHVCCAPCSASVLEYLAEFFDITVLWYNPNIYPESEYELRRETLIRLASDMGLSDKLQFIFEPWRCEDYYNAVCGLENEPEGGKRCTECFRVRLRGAAGAAKRGGFDYFCTTLTLSRHKDAVRINTIAEEEAKNAGVKWLPSEFKKRNGEGRSLELCEQYDVYRQLYCGCEFSYKARLHGAPSDADGKDGEDTNAQ